MLKLATCIAALTSIALAQSPLQSLPTPNNNGNIGGVVYFDIETGPQFITLTDIAWIAATIGAGGSSQSMDIYLGPPTWEGNNANQAAWALVATTAATTLTAGQLTAPANIPNGICLAPNKTYGVALVATLGTSGFSHNYTNGTGVGCPLSFPANQNLGGNQQVSTNELTFKAGSAQNAPFTGGVFCPRIWNGELHYTVGACAPLQVATDAPYGQGCYDQRTSYGELFPNSATGLDTANLTVAHAFVGNSYNVTGQAANTFVAPSALAVALPLSTNTDVTSVAAALGGQLPYPILFPYQGGLGVADDLEVSTSGFISPIDVSGAGTTAPAAGSNQGDISPTPAEFYDTGFARWAPHWQNQTATGIEVTAEVLATGELVITWDGTTVTGVAGSVCRYQAVFDPAGNVSYRYDGTHTGFGGGGWPSIVGFSEGAGALENPTDVSQIPLNPFATDPLDNQALSMDLDSRPILGTAPNIVIDGFDGASTALGFALIDVIQQNPGQNLAPFGAPGCSAYVSVAPIVVAAFLTGGTSPATLPFIPGGIPNNTAFNGTTFFGQAAALQSSCNGSPCNALGVTFSNGLLIFLGSL